MYATQNYCFLLHPSSCILKKPEKIIFETGGLSILNQMIEISPF
jgi:hypothetical protein